MENFCKGVIFGMIAGACVGAVVVAKNKKLSNKIKQGLDSAETKIMEIKENLEDKMSERSCGQESNYASQNSNNCCPGENENNMSFSKNNFSKKNKND